MEIILDNLSKRYGYQWVLKDIRVTFTKNLVYGISGINGSGKSTFIKLISGHLPASSGKIIYKKDGTPLSPSLWYSELSIVAPYTDLIQEYTMKEMFLFHKKFKSFLEPQLSFEKFIEIIQLADQKDKPIRFFSSGMKQKLQLGLAILSNTTLLLLDEPTSYLDSHGKKWFGQMMQENSSERIVIVASNDAFDLSLCNPVLQISDFV
jgi:ABC-type multidrug transport system ATPase subunit